MNYGIPWVRPTATSPVSNTTINSRFDPSAYLGMASDVNAGNAQHLNASHTHRFQDDSELKTSIRSGRYERDQRASTVRMVAGTSLANFSDATVLNRGTQLKIQDFNTPDLQSDYSAKFKALGLTHELLTGTDYASKKRQVFGARTAAQGSVNMIKPNTTAGTPFDGASITESIRVLYQTNQFDFTGYGLYLQDLVQVAPHWRVLAGLRYDNLSGGYSTFALPATEAGPITPASCQMKVSKISKRVGVLYQPNALQTYHFSAATSFNTSGGAYSLSANNAGFPPE